MDWGMAPNTKQRDMQVPHDRPATPMYLWGPGRTWCGHWQGRVCLCLCTQPATHQKRMKKQMDGRLECRNLRRSNSQKQRGTQLNASKCGGGSHIRNAPEAGGCAWHDFSGCRPAEPHTQLAPVLACRMR